MYQWFIGIDPGKSGAISLLNWKLSGPVKLWNMPGTPSDVWELFKSLREFTDGDQFTLLERVHSMPRDGVKAAHTFGKWVAYVEMAIIGNRLLPMETVRPQDWMGKLGCMTKGDKKVTQAKAQLLFPDMKITLKNADGLLIGYYAREVYGNR